MWQELCIWRVVTIAGLPGSRPLDIQRPDGVWVKVWPVLGQVEGDIPFLAKIMNSIGHGGKNACFHCALQATWIPAAKTNRFVNVVLDTKLVCACFDAIAITAAR